jgi:hypothetical protein
MQIYKLSIIDEKQSWNGGKIWNSQKEYGPFFVRAQSERLARELVMKSGAYHNSKSGPDGAVQILKNDPWGMYEYTRCLVESYGKHPVDGVAMILEPAGLDSKTPE